MFYDFFVGTAICSYKYSTDTLIKTTLACNFYTSFHGDYKNDGGSNKSETRWKSIKLKSINWRIW